MKKILFLLLAQSVFINFPKLPAVKAEGEDENPQCVN